MKSQLLEEFDLSAPEFWGRPQAVRHEAYAALRRHPGLPLYPEPLREGQPRDKVSTRQIERSSLANPRDRASHFADLPAPGLLLVPLLALLRRRRSVLTS